MVKDYDSLPARAAAVLGVKVGHGSRFMLARNVARGVPFYATADNYARPRHTARRLIVSGEAKSRAVVLARVVVAPSPTAIGRASFIFEKRPKPHPFAFVVDSLLDD